MGEKALKFIPMYSSIQLAIKYAGYFLSSSNGKGHGIHSPFVFDFIRKVLNDKTRYDTYKEVETLRQKLLHTHTLVDVEDFGAGGLRGSVKSRTVASIAARAAKPRKLAQLLYRIASHYRPRYIIELGTSLGISTAYLASANKKADVITGEGSAGIAGLAHKNFKELGLSNITVVKGNLDDTLRDMIDAVPHVDMVFIDGNHREAPTMQYFQELLPRMSASSVMVFDDIHWSREMESAWQKIKEHPSVMLSLDLFFMGIVFFRDDFRVKQHFAIRF